jgi:rubrerythrin
MKTRRVVIMGGLTVMAGPIFTREGTAALAQTEYPVTTDILQQSRNSETAAYRKYMAFSKQAKADGYPGIAYMFKAQATAELIHERNFEKILTRLHCDVTPLPKHRIDVASTQQNLMTAASDELDCVNRRYPDIMTLLKKEGLQDAITSTNYAWESEKQHLDILKEIQRWSPRHFEAVAKKIENETGQYFVCTICGSTVIQIPKETCPICHFASENYRKVEAPI